MACSPTSVATPPRAKDEKAEKPDFLLRESAHILADAIELLHTDQRLAARVKSFDLHDTVRVD